MLYTGICTVVLSYACLRQCVTLFKLKLLFFFPLWTVDKWTCCPDKNRFVTLLTFFFLFFFFVPLHGATSWDKRRLQILANSWGEGGKIAIIGIYIKIQSLRQQISWENNRRNSLIIEEKKNKIWPVLSPNIYYISACKFGNQYIFYLKNARKKTVFGFINSVYRGTRTLTI